MLSYLHSFHAGNKADIHKHSALSALLAHLTEKPRAISYMETHAGRGLYDLSSDEAEKTGEAKEGILDVLLNDGAKLNPYYKSALDAVHQQYGPSFYPGSPWVARHLLRDGDAVHLMEKHPAEYPALKRLMRGSGAHIHHRDGYEGVLAISPPKPRRGLVLIDPSFEVKTEYMQAARFITKLIAKWPEAVILLWYPILVENRHQEMVDYLKNAGLPDIDHHEADFQLPADKQGMQGSGLILVNTPYGFSLEIN